MSVITIVNGEERFTWSVEPDDQKLSVLRQELEAEGKMTNADVFVRDGGPISQAQEKSIAVNAVVIEGRLSIRAAAAGQGRKQITVVRGATKSSFLADPASALSALRTELAAEKLMQPGDLFLINGAVVSKDQESKPDYTVAKALDGSTLNIKAAATAGSKTIVIAKGSKKSSHTTDPAQKLDSFRKELVAASIMTAEDRFLVDGADTPVSQEGKITVERALKDGTIELKGAAAPAVRPGKTPEPPKLSDPPKRDEWTLNPTGSGDSVKNALDMLNTERTAVKSDGLVYYYQLDQTQRATLLQKKLQLDHGLAVTAKGYTKAPKSVRVISAEPGYLMPENILESDRGVSFSETLHEVRKRSSKGGSGSFGGFGVAISAAYSKEKETLHREKETHIYMFANESVPKVRLVLDAWSCQPTQSFTDAIKRALSKPGSNSPEQYIALLDVLNEYGFLMPMSFVVGGQIWDETSVWIKEVTDAEREMESFQIAFDASLEAAGYPIKAGGSYNQMNEEKKQDVKTQATKTIRRKYIGGDPGTTGKPADWMASLAASERWDIIAYEKLSPTLDLLSAEMRATCAALIQKHYPNVETYKRTALDMETYYRELSGGASEAFA